jgi:hypothetical protein
MQLGPLDCAAAAKAFDIASFLNNRSRVAAPFRPPHGRGEGVLRGGVPSETKGEMRLDQWPAPPAPPREVKD